MTNLKTWKGAAAVGVLAAAMTVWAGDAAGQPDPKDKKKDDKAARKDDKDGDLKTVMGRVKRMTEAPKGEIDGAEFADGTVIHWPPHLSKKFAAVARKGDAVEATGRWEQTPDGDKVLEVRTLTNLKTDETARTEPDAPPPPKAKDAPRPRRARTRRTRTTDAGERAAPGGRRPPPAITPAQNPIPEERTCRAGTTRAGRRPGPWSG